MLQADIFICYPVHRFVALQLESSSLAKEPNGDVVLQLNLPLSTLPRELQLAVTVGQRVKDTMQSQHAQTPLRCRLLRTVYVWRPEVNHKRNIIRSAMVGLLRYLHQYTVAMSPGLPRRAQA